MYLAIALLALGNALTANAVIAPVESKPDFAVFSPKCETEFPESLRLNLKPSHPDRIAEAFKSDDWDQDRLDLLYSCLPDARTVPTPVGFHRGGVVFPTSGGHKHLMEMMQKIGIPLNDKAVNFIAETLWKGKRFYRESDGDTTLRNWIEVGLLHQYRFPAKIYTGLSILDVRKDSLIIDYAFSEELGNYITDIDRLATRKGLMIRDEIRQVAPGFYLGRAYMDGFFALNFVLLKADEPR